MWQVLALVVFLGGYLSSPALEAHAAGYRKPSPEVVELLEASPPPVVSSDPRGRFMLLLHRRAWPPLRELAAPVVSVAGARINPQTNAPHDRLGYRAFTLVEIASGRSRRVPLPDAVRVGYPRWSPDGSRFAFTVTRKDGAELWVGKAEGLTLRRLTGPVLNAARGVPFGWMPDNHRILARLVPKDRGAPPSPAGTPAHPHVMETRNGTPSTSMADTHPATDLEGALPEYYLTSQLVLIDALSGERREVGKRAVFRNMNPSPSGAFILVSGIVRHGGGEAHAAESAETVEVWDTTGKVVRRIKRRDEGRATKAFHWRSSAPATLVWVEGSGSAGAPAHEGRGERLMALAAPFDADPLELFRSAHRLTEVDWIEKSGYAFVHDYAAAQRRSRLWLVAGERPGNARLVWDRSVDDRYAAPGRPVIGSNPSGHPVVRQHEGSVYLTSRGATAEGERTFLDRLELDTLKSERLWRSGKQAHESLVALLADDASAILTRYETETTPPNYVVHDLRARTRHQLTHFAHPVPELLGVETRALRYRRDDGLELHATLYVPPRRKPGERVPLVLWAYPRKYADADTAEQPSGSRHQFVLVERAFQLFFLLRGYAVMHGISMPIVGDRQTANDSFPEQVVANARAAIEKAIAVGVADGERVGAAGHSYGAFMVANLLAHSDLFRAGIALSGAYNRTLTPFGFQTERRTLWEAPRTYLQLSPLLYAHRIGEPLLLIHGERDSHIGTTPAQSRRFYQAVRGNGGVARLVLLPFEDHTYRARESVLHAAAEMLDWFDTYVKGEPGASTTLAAQDDS